jgi:hypothetical protein
MAMPAVARCDAQFAIPAAPSAVTCALPEEPAAPEPSIPWPTVAVAAAAVLVVVMAFLVAGRRRRPAGRPRR